MRTRTRMFELIRIIFGLLLVFFLPGFSLTRAMFPRKKTFHPDYDIIYQIAIGITLSLITVILLGVIIQGIGVNPATGMGYFTTGYLVVSLLAISGFFFFIGWFRGAYPWMGWFHPKLRRIPSSPAVTRLVKDKKKLESLHDNVAERERILKEIEFCEARADAQGQDMREHYSKKLQLLYDRLEIVNERIDEIEGGTFEKYARLKLEEGFEEELDEMEGEEAKGKMGSSPSLESSSSKKEE